MLHRKYLFLKTVADACRILAIRKNRYGNRDPTKTDANDGVVLTTINEEDKKGNKKKEVTC